MHWEEGAVAVWDHMVPKVVTELPTHTASVLLVGLAKHTIRDQRVASKLTGA